MSDHFPPHAPGPPSPSLHNVLFRNLEDVLIEAHPCQPQLEAIVTSDTIVVLNILRIYLYFEFIYESMSDHDARKASTPILLAGDFLSYWYQTKHDFFLLAGTQTPHDRPIEISTFCQLFKSDNLFHFLTTCHLLQDFSVRTAMQRPLHALQDFKNLDQHTVIDQQSIPTCIESQKACTRKEWPRSEPFSINLNKKRLNCVAFFF